MSRRLAIVVVAAVALAGCQSGGPSASERAARARDDQVRAAAAQAGLTADVQAFMASAVGSAGQPYTVTYDVGGRNATVVQRPPHRRLDLVAPAGDTEAYIANHDGTFSCQRPVTGAWSCQADSQPPPSAGVLSLDDVAAAVNSLTQSAAAYDMKVESRRLVGVDGRCLVATPRAGASSGAETLCISPTGVPLLVEGGGTSAIRATRYRASASKSAFKLPAPARSG